jgi:hypothetical protein
MSKSGFGGGSGGGGISPADLAALNTKIELEGTNASERAALVSAIVESLKSGTVELFSNSAISAQTHQIIATTSLPTAIAAGSFQLRRPVSHGNATNAGHYWARSIVSTTGKTYTLGITNSSATPGRINEFDPLTGLVSTMGAGPHTYSNTTPVNRTPSLAALNNGNIMIVGGVNSTGSMQATAHRLNVSNQTLTALANLPADLTLGAASTAGMSRGIRANSFVYFFGGEFANGAARTHAIRYNEASNTWLSLSATVPFAFAGAYIDAVSLPSGNILVANATHYAVFNTNTETFGSAQNLPPEVQGLTAIAEASLGAFAVVPTSNGNVLAEYIESQNLWTRNDAILLPVAVVPSCATPDHSGGVMFIAAGTASTGVPAPLFAWIGTNEYFGITYARRI